jgi:acetyl esterase
MPLSLKMRAVVLIMRLVTGKPFHLQNAAEASKRSRMRIPIPDKLFPVARITNRTFPGPASQIPIRIYTPHGSGPFPVLVFFHGGGFVLGGLDLYNDVCSRLCQGAGWLVVSVDYRLAPEYKYPAAPDDCLAAVHWVAAHAAEFNGNPACLALAGDSAGGTLTAVTALRLREEGGPRLCGQLLIYPATAYHTPPTPSYLENANGYLLTRDDMIWFWDQYLNSSAEASLPAVAPLCAPDLSRLPPALIITAEYDPLRDEGERYAKRLQQAGVPTVLTRYNGMVHGFFMFGGLFAESRQATQQATTWIKQLTA